MTAQKHLSHGIMDFPSFFVRVCQYGSTHTPQSREKNTRCSSKRVFEVLTKEKGLFLQNKGVTSMASSPPPSSPLHDAQPWLLCHTQGPPSPTGNLDTAAKAALASSNACWHRLSRAIISLKGHLSRPIYKLIFKNSD